jgi:hypothetical protein
MRIMPWKAWLAIIGGIVGSGLVFPHFSTPRAILGAGACLFGMWLAWKDKDPYWVSPLVVGGIGAIYFLTLLFGIRLW